MNADEISLHEPAADLSHWLVDPEIIFLNHGSFGACPRRVLEFQSECRARLERQPVQFLARELEAQLDSAHATLSSFVGADDTPDPCPAKHNKFSSRRQLSNSNIYQFN